MFIDSSSGFCQLLKRHLSEFQLDILAEGKRLDEDVVIDKVLLLAKTAESPQEKLLSTS